MILRKREYRLRSCVWEITLACCFSCKYCGSCGGEARKDELSTAECLRVAGELADLGCRRVSMIGGEVFMRPDWEEIVSALTGRGIRVCIITNGFIMSDGIIAALKRCRIESVAVSLDGPEAVHDAFRHPGSMKEALCAIDRLREAGIPVSVISSLRADNAETLPELYGILKGRGIAAWQIQACSPMGNARKNGVDVAFDASKVIAFAADLARSAPFPVGTADNIGYFTPEEPILRGRYGACFDGCSAGLTTLGIDSAGNVRGCESMYDDRFIEGNLREHPLADIWNDPDAFAYNRKFRKKMLTDKCRKCRMGDVCRGGCRSYNYFTNGGDLYGNVLCARKQK